VALTRWIEIVPTHSVAQLPKQQPIASILYLQKNETGEILWDSFRGWAVY